MNYPCTYGDIYRWNAEIAQFLSKPKSILSIINQEDKDVIAFMNENKLRFEAVMQRGDLISDKYFETVADDKGNVVPVFKEGKQVFKEGMKEEDIQAELKEFFATNSSVTL